MKFKWLRLIFFFEPIWKVSGEYKIDFYRKNVHRISLDADVKEVLIGSTVLPVLTQTGVWKKLKKGVKIGGRKNTLDLSVEEHLEIEKMDEVYLNSNGQEIKPLHKITVKNIESFLDDFIKSNKNKMRPSKLTQSDVVERFLDFVKKDIGEYTKIIRETLEISTLEQIYLPIYEVRCIGPKNSVKFMRIDGMISKVI